MEFDLFLVRENARKAVDLILSPSDRVREAG